MCVFSVFYISHYVSEMYETLPLIYMKVMLRVDRVLEFNYVKAVGE